MSGNLIPININSKPLVLQVSQQVILPHVKLPEIPLQTQLPIIPINLNIFPQFGQNINIQSSAPIFSSDVSITKSNEDNPFEKSGMEKIGAKLKRAIQENMAKAKIAMGDFAQKIAPLLYNFGPAMPALFGAEALAAAALSTNTTAQASMTSLNVDMPPDDFKLTKEELIDEMDYLMDWEIDDENSELLEETADKFKKYLSENEIQILCNDFITEIRNQIDKKDINPDSLEMQDIRKELDKNIFVYERKSELKKLSMAELEKLYAQNKENLRNSRGNNKQVTEVIIKEIEKKCSNEQGIEALINKNILLEIEMKIINKQKTTTEITLPENSHERNDRLDKQTLEPSNTAFSTITAANNSTANSVNGKAGKEIDDIGNKQENAVTGNSDISTNTLSEFRPNISNYLYIELQKIVNERLQTIQNKQEKDMITETYTIISNFPVETEMSLEFKQMLYKEAIQVLGKKELNNRNIQYLYKLACSHRYYVELDTIMAKAVHEKLYSFELNNAELTKIDTLNEEVKVKMDELKNLCKSDNDFTLYDRARYQITKKIKTVYKELTIGAYIDICRIVAWYIIEKKMALNNNIQKKQLFDSQNRGDGYTDITQKEEKHKTIEQNSTLSVSTGIADITKVVDNTEVAQEPANSDSDETKRNTGNISTEELMEYKQAHPLASNQDIADHFHISEDTVRNRFIQAGISKNRDEIVKKTITNTLKANNLDNIELNLATDKETIARIINLLRKEDITLRAIRLYFGINERTWPIILIKGHIKKEDGSYYQPKRLDITLKMLKKDFAEGLRPQEIIKKYGLKRMDGSDYYALLAWYDIKNPNAKNTSIRSDVTIEILEDYRKNHPLASYQEIADYFHISSQTVSKRFIQAGINAEDENRDEVVKKIIVNILKANNLDNIKLNLATDKETIAGIINLLRNEDISLNAIRLYFDINKKIWQIILIKGHIKKEDGSYYQPKRLDVTLEMLKKDFAEGLRPQEIIKKYGLERSSGIDYYALLAWYDIENPNLKNIPTAELIEYKKAHPLASYKDIGDHFHITQEAVSKKFIKAGIRAEDENREEIVEEAITNTLKANNLDNIELNLATDKETIAEIINLLRNEDISLNTIRLYFNIDSSTWYRILIKGHIKKKDGSCYQPRRLDVTLEMLQNDFAEKLRPQEIIIKHKLKNYKDYCELLAWYDIENPNARNNSKIHQAQNAVNKQEVEEKTIVEPTDTEGTKGLKEPEINREESANET